MGKTTNYLKNLLGAALMALSLAQAAAAAPWTANPMGKHITADVAQGPCSGGETWCNKVELVPGNSGSVYAVWTRPNGVLPNTYDIKAQRLAASDGSYVWGSTITLMSQVTQGAKNSGWNYVGPALSTGGQTTVSSIRVHVNPTRPYASVSSVGLYADSDPDGVWTQRDQLLSSAPVTGQYATLTFPPGTTVDPSAGVVFITLTPSAGAVGSSVNLGIDVATHVVTAGAMAAQAIYPVRSPVTPVQLFAPIADLAPASAGAGLTSMTLKWTYPQSVPADSHVVIHFSTNAADLAFAPVSPSFVIPLSTGVTPGSVGEWTSPDLAVSTAGMRVFPQYFAAWIYNGVSTSAPSNLAQNLHFPVFALADGPNTLRLRAGMQAYEARAARSPDGSKVLNAVTFDSEGRRFLMFRNAAGNQFYFSDFGGEIPGNSLTARRLTADNDGNAYALLETVAGPKLMKVGADGSSWQAAPFSGGEMPKAVLYGGNPGALYAAADVAGTTSDIALYRFSPGSGAFVSSYTYDSSALFGGNSEDRVNGLALTQDAGGVYLYAAGFSGAPGAALQANQPAATVHKFQDTGAGIRLQAGGNWPLRHSNPSGGFSEATVIRADQYGNLVVAGTEQRYDVDPYGNLWVNKFNAFGAPMFAAPGRYNQQGAEDVPAALDIDSYGGIHAAGYTNMWMQGQSRNVLVARFGPGGQFLSAKVFGAENDEFAAGVFVSSDNFVNAAGVFGAQGLYGVYSMPLAAAGAAAQFFTAAEGPYTGSVDLMWNYPGNLPAGSTYYVQYSTLAAPAWNRAAAQLSALTGPKFAGEVQQLTVGALHVLRYPDQSAENRAPQYRFKVWVASGGAVYELPAQLSYAKTPPAYDNSYFLDEATKRDRVSYMSGLSMPGSALVQDGAYAYHAFAGKADGGNAGFGLRKYNLNSYLEWTKFFNHAGDRAYYVGSMTRDAAGNFYIVGSVAPVSYNQPYMDPGKDLWIAKLNASGDLLWSYSQDAGSGGMDELYDAALEGNTLYVVGTASSPATGMDVFARKFSLAGALPSAQATFRLAGGGAADFESGYGIAVGTGTVYLAGTVKNASLDMAMIALNKADLTQAWSWTKDYSGGGLYEDEGYDVAIATTTPPYLYFGGSAFNLAGSAGKDAVLYKLSLAGSEEWSASYGASAGTEEGVYSVAALSDGAVVAGYATVAGEGKNSIFRKYSDAGAVAWSRSFNLPRDAGNDEIYSVSVDPAGRVCGAAALYDERPGFACFPEPVNRVNAGPGPVPGSVILDWPWMSETMLPSGSGIYVQVSTFAGASWNFASASLAAVTSYDTHQGMMMNVPVFGLYSGRDALGMPVLPLYHFKVWTKAGADAPVLVAASASSARPMEGYAFENVAVYPGDSRLFLMGEQYYSGGWEKEFPGAARDASGNLYTVASLNFKGSGGFAVKKFNSSFAPVWTRYYAPGEWYQVKANRIAADAAGNIYVTGYERSPAGVTGRDLFLLKLDANGTAWKRTFDLAGGDDAGYGVALDGSGNVYVAGSAQNGGDFALAAKYGPAGVLLSTVTYYGDGGAAAYGAAVHGGDLFLAGSAQINTKGSQLWLGRYRASDLAPVGSYNDGLDDAGSYEEAAFDVAVDSSGIIYSGGQIYDADEGTLDAIVYKSSADFTPLWAGPAEYGSQAMGVDSVRALHVDAAGAVYAAGYTERYDVNQDRNLWLRKYAADGTELWTQEFHAAVLPNSDPYAGPSSDEGFSLAVGTMGYVSVSGRFGGYYGLYLYRQSVLTNVNPVLTVEVSSAACRACAPVKFAGVGVRLIPFSATGGIDVAGSTAAVTGPLGTASFQVPSGKQYFIALDRQGYDPSIRDQLMDSYGSFFVQPVSDLTKRYTLLPRPAAEPYYPLAVYVTSVTARDYVMAEVFFSATGEKAGYGIAQVPAGVTATTVTVTNLPPAAANAYTLGVTVPARSLARAVQMTALFPNTSAYMVNMSTTAGAMTTTGGFEAGASTTPASVEGVARSAGTLAPLQDVRVRLFNRADNCWGDRCEYNVYETLTDVNGKYAFYNVVSSAAYQLVAQKASYKRVGYWGETVLSTATLRRHFTLEPATYTLRGYLRYRDLPVPGAEVMAWGDYSQYSGSDTYRAGYGIDTDARTKTGADGSFVFSPGTGNGLPDGQVRLQASFFGSWTDLNEGNIASGAVDSDDWRVVISSDTSRWGNMNDQIALAGNCRPGRAWKIEARTGICRSPSTGEISFNITPAVVNEYATLSGSVTFITSYTVTEASPLVISTGAPITITAMQACDGNCGDGTRAMGFATISGALTQNWTGYSISLSTGLKYYTRVTSGEWGEISSFDDRADFSSTTLSVRMNFTVTRAGGLKGTVKLPDGNSYKPVYSDDPALSHRLDVRVSGQNVGVDEGWGVDQYGAFEFPNLAPGLYTITLRPQGEGFRWATPTMTDISVAAGKTTQVTMKLESGLYVQPQIIGLPEISTPTWAYLVIPVPSGTEMNQKRITEMFFGEDVFSFEYSTASQTFDTKLMQVGQYDFYLMLGARYNPGFGNNEAPSFDQFGNFIGKVKGVNVQRSDATPNLGTEAQPIPVNILGSIGQEVFEGTVYETAASTGAQRLYSSNDLKRIFSNMSELFPVIPAVMIYDAAGDLRGYTAALPREADFNEFWSALTAQDEEAVRVYLRDHPARFMAAGLPPGRYTVVFNNPNYPPVAKEINIPLADSFGGLYAFDFAEENIRVGTVYGTVRSTVPEAGVYTPLDNAVVYLKHKTVEKFATTDANGQYRFDNMPPGIYRLEVTREGFVKNGVRTTLAGDDSARADFYLTPSQTNMVGKVFMSKFPSPVTRSGVKIVAYDETFNVERPTEYLPKIEATTNDSGEYELPGVVPGHNYKVSAFFNGKQTYTLDVDSDTVTEGVTYLPDIVLRDMPPQIVVKVRRSPDSVNKADVTIKSPKMLVTTPVCRVNQGETYVSTSAVSLALVPGPNNTYAGQFIISQHQRYYTVYVAAGDGSSRMEKSVTFSPSNAAKTEQYVNDEAIQGGEVQMDKETEEYSGIELDAGGLTATGGSAGSGVSAFSPSDNLVGGFFSSLPSVRTVKTAKGELSLAQAITDLMASEVYNMELNNAQANKPFTLTLKYDKEKAADGANLRIYQYDEATQGWNEVPGNYTTDPMLGVLSVGVSGLEGASQGASAASTPLGRKRLGMSAVANGRYVPSAASGTQSGRFAVFTARPSPNVAYAGVDFEVANLPNPFNLKDKTVTNLEGTAAFSGATTYVTRGTLIKYHLPSGKSGAVKFVIYNLAGEKVRTISDGTRSGGNMYYSEWDGKNDNNQDVASGVYFMLAYVDGEKLGSKAHKLAVIK